MCTCLAVWGEVARREWPRLALEALPLKCWDFKPGYLCSIGNLFAFKVTLFFRCKEYHGVLYAFLFVFPLDSCRLFYLGVAMEAQGWSVWPVRHWYILPAVELC